MKSFILTSCFTFIFLLNAVAQIDLFASFNSTYTGRNISATVSKYYNNKHELGGGIRFNINRLPHPDDQNNLFKKRLYATKPLYYFGIEGFYHRYILKNWKNIKPFLFYDLQLTYSTTRTRMLLPFTYDANGDVLYKEYIEFFGPFLWLEQNVGVGFKANLFSNWYLKQKLGFGTSFILGKEEKLLGKNLKRFDWEFAYLINVGIGYSF